MSDNPEDLEVGQIDTAISDKISFLFESNAKMLMASREMASDMLRMAEGYEFLAAECREIATLHAIGARKVADITGDLVSAEWGIVEVEEVCDDVDPDDE